MLLLNKYPFDIEKGIPSEGDARRSQLEDLLSIPGCATGQAGKEAY